MEDLLERSLQIAVEAHSGQKDKYGAPLVFHPIRMMMRLSGHREKITALLHDVVEKSEWTLDGLRREGFPPEIVRAVDLLTRRRNEDYEEYLSRVKTDPLAVRVKRADLEDHMDPARAAALTPDILDKIRKSHASRAALDQPASAAGAETTGGKKP
jgi:(p)ppGpp synthase/HD superfamily hydrolase